MFLSVKEKTRCSTYLLCAENVPTVLAGTLQSLRYLHSRSTIKPHVPRGVGLTEDWQIHCQGTECPRAMDSESLEFLVKESSTAGNEQLSLINSFNHKADISACKLE